jgi:hypothetical protein
VDVEVVTSAGTSNALGFSYKIDALQITASNITGKTTDIFGLIPQDVLLPIFSPAYEGATKNQVEEDITIENVAQTWYWVQPASALVAGAELPTKPFLIGPGATRTFHQLTFAKNGYITFHASNSICLLVAGGNWPAPWQLPTCLADDQSRAIIWAMEGEIMWRSIFGGPLPTDLADAIYDPVTFTLAQTVLQSDKAFALASDIGKAVTRPFDPYAAGHIPGDVLDMAKIKDLNDLLELRGHERLTRRVIQYLNVFINAGVALKFVVETALYPTDGDVTFVAK